MDELDHNPVHVALRGRCPRCASGRLFEGYLAPARECEACGLDFRFIDSGDGPAVFVILLVGFLTVGLALWVEVAHGPALWVHFALWPALAIAVSLPLLRALKGAMIGQQFRESAAEGRVAMRAATPPRTASACRADAVRALTAADATPPRPPAANADKDAPARPRDEPDRVA